MLADPKMLQDRDFRVALAVHSADSPRGVARDEVAALNLFDTSSVLAYSKADLERALRDLSSPIIFSGFFSRIWTRN